MIDDLLTHSKATEIELELRRVRAEAEVARLDARAAELELQLQRMRREHPIRHDDLPNRAAAATFSSKPDGFQSHGPSITQDSWAIRTAKLQNRLPEQPSGPLFPVASPSRNLGEISLGRLASAAENRLSDLNGSDLDRSDLNEETQFVRTDSGSAMVAAPNIGLLESSKPETAKGNDFQALRYPGPPRQLHSHAREPQATETQSVIGATIPFEPANPPVSSKIFALFSDQGETVKAKLPLPIAMVTPLDDESEEGSQRRFRPASWFVSSLVHAAILVLLGLFTLSSKPPKDQVAFSASSSESNEESMETFSIESNEPIEESEPVPSETAYDISAVGTMAIAELSMDVPPAPVPMASTEFLNESSSAMSKSMMKSLASESDSKMKFCGVEGGGNHFVYLVDSSGSMRDGFQAARNELLDSIDQLTADQRFYVVFFDEEPSYMRISDPNTDETASVMATPENKAKLRQWAMTVQMNKGKAPYEVLPFALNLRPDVIFLLSDGEFPTAIEEILQEQNRDENLFGDSGPISIVHTIRYHGIEGETGRKAEATMIKIAKENGGQYRHVPKPKS